MKAHGTKPTWTDVKEKLTDFDRAGLIGLVQDLYMLSKDNQAFLHARFDYRLIVAVAYKVGVVYVKVVGTHRQYDTVNAETVEMA